MSNSPNNTDPPSSDVYIGFAFLAYMSVFGGVILYLVTKL